MELKVHMNRHEVLLTEEDLIVSWVGDKVLAVFRPVHMGNKAGVSLGKRQIMQSDDWTFFVKTLF